MEYEKLKKEELIDLLNKKDAELSIAYQGVKEKDKMIVAKDIAIRGLEDTIKQFEKNVEGVIAEKVQAVHLSYANVVAEAKLIRTELDRVNRGLIVFDNTIDKLKELKNKQNEILDDFVKQIQDEFIIKEEVNNG